MLTRRATSGATRGVFSNSTTRRLRLCTAPTSKAPFVWIAATLPKAGCPHARPLQAGAPAVRIEASVDHPRHARSSRQGQLDLALIFRHQGRADAERSRSCRWRGSAVQRPIGRRRAGAAGDVRGALCFRQTGISALDAAGMPWRVTFTIRVSRGCGPRSMPVLELPCARRRASRHTWKVFGARSGLRLPTELSLHTAGRPLSPASQRLKNICAIRCRRIWERRRDDGAASTISPSWPAPCRPSHLFAARKSIEWQ